MIIAIVYQDIQALKRLHKRSVIAVKRRGISSASESEKIALNRVHGLINRALGIKELFTT